MVTLADVASRVEIVTPSSWTREPLRDAEIDGDGEPGCSAPTLRNTVIVAADDTGDEIFLDTSGFLTLLHGSAGGQLTPIKRAPAFFDAAGLGVAQHFATSDDGTRVPYFVVGKQGSQPPGPTLLSGYGGFEVAQTPGYGGVLGRLWLSRGGTYVWPTSAAAANTARAGTPRPSAQAGTRSRRISLRWHGSSSNGASPPRRSWGRRAAATAGC